jgi:DNA-binding response OmpR family regulator
MNNRILYVDDDADSRDLVQVWLSLYGYTVVTAATMADALRLSKIHVFDIYILDNWLPDGSGIYLCQQIRAFHQQTPILFFSGAAYSTDREQAIHAGAQAYLTKPADLQDLYDTVVQLIKEVEVAATK